MPQRVTVDDPELSKLGIPILRVNSKCVAEFIRRQEALSAKNVTDQGLSVLCHHQSVVSTNQPPTAEFSLEERPHTTRQQVQYRITPSLAGTRKGDFLLIVNRNSIWHTVSEILQKYHVTQFLKVINPFRVTPTVRELLCHSQIPLKSYYQFTKTAEFLVI